MPRKKFYAVANGKVPGIYEDWDSAKVQVIGYPGSSFKSFPTMEEAQQFIVAHSRPHVAEAVLASSGHAPSYGSSYSASAESSYSSSQPPPRKKPKFAEIKAEEDVQENGPPIAAPSAPHTPEPTKKPPKSRSEVAESIAPISAEESAKLNHQAAFIDPIPDILAPTASPPQSSTTSPTKKRSNKRTTSTSWAKTHTIVYTDGACSSNGQLGATAGIGVYFGANDPRNVSETLKGASQTNQRAELTAAIRAMEVMKDDPAHLEIRSDSQYVVKGMNEWLPNWNEEKFKEAKNEDLWKAIWALKGARKGPTSFVHVAAHSGIPGNEAADQLAVNGIPRKR